MKKERAYRKLASAHQFGIAKGGWPSLYLADDYLLLRTSRGFIENYRRFYFTDIEAITISQSVSGIFWNTGLALGLLVSVVAGLNNPPPHLASGIFGGLFLVALLLNVSRGTTCRAQLQTRVQTQSLPLRRVRTATRVVAALSERINLAQANLVVPEMGTPPNTVPPAAGNRAPGSVLPPPLPQARATGTTTWLELAMLALFFASGMLALLEAQRHSSLVYTVYCLVVINLVSSIAAVIQSRSRRVRSRTGPVAWISVIGHAITLPVVYTIFSIVSGVEAARRVKPGQVPAVQLTMNGLRELAGFNYVLLGYGIFALFLGCAGTIILVSRPERLLEKGRL